MKKSLLSIIACSTLFMGTAQTQIFFEDFGAGAGGFTLNTATQGGVVGTGGDNYWLVNNVYAGGSGTVMFCSAAMGQAFTVNATPAQPAGISNANGNYLHIVAEEAVGNGILNANYGLADVIFCIPENSHFAEMTNDINTSNFTGVTVDFWWLNEATPEAQGELWYSTDGGTTWTQKTGTTYQGVSVWTNDVLTDAAWDGQSQLRFGFRFNNTQTTAAADPGFAIDDFEVSGTLGTPCTDNSSSYSVNSCGPYTVPSGDEIYTASGTQTVMDTILNVSGCDSVMTISLTITNVDTSVVNNMDGTATAQASSGTFQWLDCDNAMAPVSGETSAVFAPSVAGNYAVEVTDNGCVDTSSCYNIQSGSIYEFESNEFTVFPNPSIGNFSIDISGLKGNHLLTIVDSKGSTVLTETIPAGGILEYNLDLQSGIYIVKLVDQHGMVRRSRLMID